MSLFQKILGNTVIQIAGKLTTAFIALGTINILSRYFSPSGFSDYGTVYSILALFSAFADMGIYTIVLRDMALHESEKQKWYSLGIILRFLTSIIAMICCVAFVFLIPAYDHTWIPFGVMIASVGTLFMLMSGIVSVVLQYYLKMQYYALAMIFGKIFIFLGLLLFTQVFFPLASFESFLAIIAFGSLGSVVIFIITWWFSHSFFPLLFLFDWKSLWNLFKKAFPFGIATLLNILYFQMGMLSFHFLLPRSQNTFCTDLFCADIESSKYLVALRMVEVLMYFPVFFMGSLLPSLTAQVQSKSVSSPSLVSYGFLFLIFLGFPMGICTALMAPSLVLLLAPESFLSTEFSFGSDSAFFVLAFSLGFAFLNVFIAYVLIALGKQSQVMIRSFIAVCLEALLLFILVPHFGLIGASMATAFTEVFVFVFGIILLFRYHPFPILWKGILQVFFAIAGASLVIFYSQYFFSSLLLTLFLSGFSFFFLLFKIGFFTPELKKIFSK